jgi:multidrug efflux pump subunit AcrA (membrane-fusion protein)
MFVKVDIIIAARPRTIVIPTSIISTRRGNKTVFVVEKGAALERSIETGLQNRDEIEVLRGLKVGERLVVKGFETLRDRSRVKIIN